MLIWQKMPLIHPITKRENQFRTILQIAGVHSPPPSPNPPSLSATSSIHKWTIWKQNHAALLSFQGPVFPRFIWQTMGTWKRVLHVQSPVSPSSTCALPGSYVPHFNMGTCTDSKSQISVRRWTLVHGIESLNHYMPVHHHDLRVLTSSLLGKGTTTSCTNTESWHGTLNREARTHPICT